MHSCPTLQVFLIGDPVQLPATVISKRAVSFNYDVSLFKRLQTNGHPVHMLDTQYRMHPRISAFPSATFYHGDLKNGPGVAEHTKRSWHADKVKSCRPRHLKLFIPLLAALFCN